MDTLGELFLANITKEGSASIEKINQGLRTWVETELIDKSIIRKVLQVSNERPIPVEGGLGYPFAKLSPDVDGVYITGEFPSIKPNISRQTVVPAVLVKIINGHVADNDQLRAVTDMQAWIREKVIEEVEFKENVMLVTALATADATPTAINTTNNNFAPEAMPTIKTLLTAVNLKSSAMVLKESLYNDIAGWDNTLVSDATLDSIKNSAEPISGYAGVNIIPLQDRVFTKAGSTADGYVLTDKRFIGFLLEGTPLSVSVEKEKNLTMLFSGAESLGVSIINTNSVQAFTIT
jgi:hypothetical protein